MRKIALLMCFIGVLGFIVSFALAERISDKREDATHIVIGEVKGVFTLLQVGWKKYIVMMELESVEKGSDYKSGDIFYVYCFQKGPLNFEVVGAGGHRAVPIKGQRIKAFVHRRNGLFEGNYPIWFDLLEPDKRSDE